MNVLFRFDLELISRISLFERFKSCGHTSCVFSVSFFNSPCFQVLWSWMLGRQHDTTISSKSRTRFFAWWKCLQK